MVREFVVLDDSGPETVARTVAFYKQTVPELTFRDGSGLQK